MPEDDPLTELYSDESPYDRSQLASDLEAFVKIDPDSGNPVPQRGFGSLTPKEQAVVLLLYRKVAAELGEIQPDEEAVQMMWIDRNSKAEEPDVDGYPQQLEFVHRTDEEGSLFVPDHQVDDALGFLDGDK